jgi:hypothetical protein
MLFTLATLGIYWVTAYGLARRTAEIRIRMALGAERSSVTSMVLKGALLQAGIGLTSAAHRVPVRALCQGAALTTSRGLIQSCWRRLLARLGWRRWWRHSPRPGEQLP